MNASNTTVATAQSTLFKPALLAMWSELPRMLLACAVWAISLVPALVGAWASAPWWLLGPSLLPAFLVASGTAHCADSIRVGERMKMATLRRADPVVAFFSTLGCTAAMALIAAGGWIASSGYVLAAVLLLTLPKALTYGPVRRYQGLRALRGGVLLSVLRPGSALVLASIAALLALAVAASGGVLVLIAPAFLAQLTAFTVAAELAAVDGAHPLPSKDHR